MKATRLIIAAFALLIATGCNGQSKQEVKPSNNTAMSKSIVIFFSHAGDNYSVGNIEVGNTKIVADYISEIAGADQFEIVTHKYDGMAYTPLINLAKEEANHWKVIERHGFTPLFKVDIMDEEGEMRIPVQDSTHLKYDIVGGHIANYDFMIALNHFKGHPMGGYGGALKNLSIGCASSNGKAYIHSAGKMEVLDMAKLWTKEYIGNQDGFLESMAAAAQAVVDYFQKKDGIIYINVMNNMSIDCDCVDHPAPVKLEDYGILASTDPVALDQACVDIINNQQVTATNDPTDLLNRIDKQHGVHTIEHAETIGLGSRKYTIVNIDEAE